MSGEGGIIEILHIEKKSGLTCKNDENVTPERKPFSSAATRLHD